MSDRSELYNAYMNAAKKQVKQSDKSYDQAISQTMRRAIASGMGRSSYNIATQANLENDKLTAANQIKSDANDAFIQAWLAYKQQQEQIDLQNRQFEWEKEQAAASAAASGGYGGYTGNTTGNPTSNVPSYMDTIAQMLGNGASNVASTAATGKTGSMFTQYIKKGKDYSDLNKKWYTPFG